MKYLAAHKPSIICLYLICVWIVVATLTSCATVKPEAPVEKPVKEYPVSGWGTGRDKMALDAFAKYGKELLAAKPADAEKWCPNFEAVDKAHFYTALMSALAKYESNYKSATTYTEAFADAKGVKVVSAGILQQSVESGRSYGCPVSKASDFFDDKISIECAVRIASKWVVKDGVIQGGGPGAWRGFARYWSPFRKADHIAVMKKAVGEVCETK